MNSQLCVVDPENSVFFDYYNSGNSKVTCTAASKIEGIGRPRAEPSFIPGVVDQMRKIPDAASIATINWLETIIGRKTGPSTGTNLYGVLQLASEMVANGQSGSIVTLLCDSGERYLDTYYNAQWIADNIGDLTPYANALQQFSATNKLDFPSE